MIKIVKMSVKKSRSKLSKKSVKKCQSKRPARWVSEVKNNHKESVDGHTGWKSLLINTEKQ